MSLNSNGKPSGHILFCRCGGERIQKELLSRAEAYLDSLDFNVTVLDDLCGLAARKPELLQNLFSDGEGLLIAGCYSRTMDLLLDGSIRNFREKKGTEYINLLELHSYDDFVSKTGIFCADKGEGGNHTVISDDPGWPSWYPVIDYSRCTACGQCAEFCLFGVYEKEEGRINVVNPTGCKNNCPACSRICPSTAIIFPKYIHGGAIGGSGEIDEVAEQQRQAKDIETILGDDLYAALANRKIKRQSIIRQEAMNKAFAERETALKNNKQKGN
jgi:NAD-dependent dihydropyrimidine dehydrogenase PreA subunit